MRSERDKFRIEKEKLIADYEEKIRILEEKIAAEIRKMEDSSGYLKKMYEEKISNYEKEIKDLRTSLSSSERQN